MTTAAVKAKPHGRERNTYGLPQGEPIRRELVRWFRRQRQAVLTYLRTGRLSRKDLGGPPAAWPDWDDFGLGSLAMSERMAPKLEAIWDEQGSKFAAKIGLDANDWEVNNPHVQSAIDKAALDFCASTNGTTSLELTEALTKTREALTTGLIEGTGIADLTRRVAKIFDAAETWRARRIATTEASRATHAAQEMLAVQSGVVTGWRWMLSEDACPRCQTVARRVPAVQLGQPFAVIGSNPAYSTVKHPPLHPYCQCALEEILDIDPQPKQWAAPLIDPEPEEQDYPPDEAPAEPPKRARKPAPPKAAKPTLLRRAESQARVTFVPDENARGNREYSTVVVDVEKVDRDLHRDPNRVGPAGTGAAIGGRYGEFQRFLARARETGQAIEQPRASLSVNDGRISLSDGRHRFAVFRDEGQDLLPVTVPKNEAAKIRRMYGAKP